ncbi:type IV pilus assembly protein PilB [Hydrogenivirga caldilitoris]|uniref:Type IV pilus assembly protein PilB n=1 Tax=Hydrogenivirga caldilitoris TaxID=246264 RepID=A0A497XSL7_9AQUI|nr:GspE/PulE family protein [Hydrogenivirga caldilitoris]RLJ70122.1 type IV pilus assembly protein PilB [Hydrogenivirga caldilitoris]
MARKRLGELLEELGYLTGDQLEVALDVQKLNGKSLGNILIDLSFVSPSELAQAIAYQAGKEFIDLSLYSPSLEALKLIDRLTAKQLEVLPLSVEERKLKLAVSDPFNVNIVDLVRRRTGLDVEIYVSDKESILRSIEIYYEQLEKPLEEQIEDIIKKASAGEADIPKLVDLILNEGIIERATDVHISPETSASHVFYRIDGVLHHYFSLPRDIHPSIVSRVKIMSGMDISEQRLPQDGGFSYTFLGESYDVRSSTLPTAYGENVVMRLLPKNLSLFNLRNLGFEEDILQEFEEVISKPYGMILVTGPTGSGKTTTLYASLRRINSLRKNILTVEDPIEYRFPFIKQTQVNEKAGYTFARAVRHFLRQDPDVILIGEIRDEETAEMAVRAAITGHLVLSTLHTNDAVSTIPRLIDLKVKEYMVASGVLAISAQRLIRKICMFCKEEYRTTREELKRFGFSEESLDKYLEGDEVTLHRGRGCEHCRGTGYLGRLSVVELLKIDEEIGDMIVRGYPPLAILQRAKEKGMRTLKEDGLLKVLKGITTPEEVKRVVG